MDSINSLGAAPTTSQSIASGGLGDANLDDFLGLMIAELQNQDPMNPMENSEMLQQLNQIRSIGATDQLTETLQSVLIGQNLSTASSLIGKQIDALTDDGQNINGLVNRISVETDDESGGRAVRVHVEDHDIDLKNVRAIRSSETDDTAVSTEP